MTGAAGAPVDGTVDAAFAPVREVFADLLATGRETGAAVAVWAGGRLVADLWGGWADAARTTPWRRDTLVTVYSVSKPLAALAALRCVARGVLTLDEPLTRWWPDFGQHGKEGATLRHALAHQAGVPALAGPQPVETLLDHPRFAAAVAATPPEWPPGTAHGEHALTYGTLLGEVVRRADGRTLGQVLRDELAVPLGLDVAIGVPTELHPRLAEVEHADAGWRDRAVRAPGSLWHRALTSPAGALDVDVVNSAAWRTAEIGAVNGHASASALARLYAGLLCSDERILPRGLLDEALRTQAHGPDRLLERDVAWTLGFQRDDGYVGMGGTGGSSAFLSERHGYAFAYVTRHLAEHDRADAIADVTETCV